MATAQRKLSSNKEKRHPQQVVIATLLWDAFLVLKYLS